MEPSTCLATLGRSGPSRPATGQLRVNPQTSLRLLKLSKLALGLAVVLGAAGLLMTPATPSGTPWLRGPALASTAGNRTSRKAAARPPQVARGGLILGGLEGAVARGQVFEVLGLGPPRPAGSKVPASDRYAVITWLVAGVVLPHPVVDVGRRSKVRQLIRAVNGLLTIAPGTVFCDLTRGDVSITFHRSRGAPSNARVREQLGCNSVVVQTATNTFGLSPGHLIEVLTSLSGLKVGQVN
jgi:hypothetical protein